MSKEFSQLEQAYKNAVMSQSRANKHRDHLELIHGMLATMLKGSRHNKKTSIMYGNSLSYEQLHTMIDELKTRGMIIESIDYDSITPNMCKVITKKGPDYKKVPKCYIPTKKGIELKNAMDKVIELWRNEDGRQQEQQK